MTSISDDRIAIESAIERSSFCRGEVVHVYLGSTREDIFAVLRAHGCEGMALSSATTLDAWGNAKGDAAWSIRISPAAAHGGASCGGGDT